MNLVDPRRYGVFQYLVDQANVGSETLDMKSFVIEFCNNAATSRYLVCTDLLRHYKILQVLLN